MRCISNKKWVRFIKFDVEWGLSGVSTDLSVTVNFNIIHIYDWSSDCTRLIIFCTHIISFCEHIVNIVLWTSSWIQNSHGLLGILMYWSEVVGASALSSWYDGALEMLLLMGKRLYHDDIWLLGWCGNQANSHAHLRIEVGSSDSRFASQFLPKNAYSWSHPSFSGRAFCLYCGRCECEDNYSLSILRVNKTKYLGSSYTEESLEYFHFTFDFRRTIFTFWYLPPRFRRLVLSSRVLFNPQIYKPSISLLTYNPTSTLSHKKITSINSANEKNRLLRSKPLWAWKNRFLWSSISISHFFYPDLFNYLFITSCFQPHSK